MRKNIKVDQIYVDKNLGNLVEKENIVICRNNDEKNQKSRRHFPYLISEAAQWLKEYEIKMLGIDGFFLLGKDIPSIRKVHQT